MRIRRLEWDDYRVEHIARHDVAPEEVWEVCQDRFHLAHREGQDRYRMHGQTMDMNTIEVSKFATYEEEAAFWDNLDTAPFMEDDGNWFHFDIHP